MKLYAESSAVLAWLLGKNDGEKTGQILADAQQIFSSDLTLVECDRVLVRAVSLGLAQEGSVADRRALLNRVSHTWSVVRLVRDVIDRARRPFPIEPVRALDALHLAAAVVVRERVEGVAMLALDNRVRNNARQMGFELLPS